MNSCKVGIIVPSFNQLAYLSQAIDSVLAQTHTQFYLFIVNDYIWKPDSE